MRVGPDFDVGRGQLTGANWRLPGETDLAALRDRLVDATAKGEAVPVEVEMSDNPLDRHTVIVNPSQAHSVLLAEPPEPDE